MFVQEWSNSQQVKAEHLKIGGINHSTDIRTWKWEAINMEFVVGLPRTRKLHDAICVIVDRMTKSSHFILVKSTYRDGDYDKIYINEIVRSHGIPLSIISNRVS